MTTNVLLHVLVPSSYFTWMGQTGFAEVSKLEQAGYFQYATPPPIYFSIRSGRTGSKVEFNQSSLKLDREGCVASWTYEGLDDNGNLITLIIFNE